MSPSFLRGQARRATLVMVTAAAGVSALAGSAHAAVIDDYAFSMNLDPAHEVTMNDGNVAWTWKDSVLTPRVTGDLEVVGGDDASYRVRVDTIDFDNKKIGASVYDDPDGHHLRTDDERHFAVDVTGTAASNAMEVEVMLEKKSDDAWKVKDHVYSAPHPPSDAVKITGTGIDVGGNSFSSTTHQPLDSASVWYKLGTDGRLTATYHGWLHLEPPFSVGANARVELCATQDACTVFDDGPAHWLTTPVWSSFEDTLSVQTGDAPKFQVKMQTQGTDPYTGAPVWRDAGAQTVSVAE